MRKLKVCYLLALAGVAAFPSASHAQPGIEILVSHIGDRGSDGTVPVEVRLLNTSDQSQTVVLPNRVEARFTQGEGARAIWLERAAAMPASVVVASAGFVSTRYSFSASFLADGALLSVPAWNDQKIAITGNAGGTAGGRPVTTAEAAKPTPATVADAPTLSTAAPADRSTGNAFLANLSAYEPIYAVYGPGTNTDARLQLSFKYQLFGSHARQDGGRSVLDGLYFAYTQRMFWDLGAESSPFRNIDYQPELFYLSPGVAVSDKATLSGQIGVRHESNGRSGDASRSVNGFYLAPMAAFSLSGDTRLVVAPRLWFYAGDLSDNPDIRRYRGNTGLVVEIGEEDGLRLSTSSRFNFSSGKGSVSADLSYPMRRILGGGPDFYLFGQSFLGYGENLLDYNKHTTRFRIGVALVR